MKLSKIITMILGLMLIMSSNLFSATEQEKDALIALYDSTAGDGWDNNTSWGIGDPCDNNWYGISCTNSGSVTDINLSSNKLAGPIPKEIGDLANLNSLILGGMCGCGGTNEINGTIPPEIGNLTNLTILSLNAMFGMGTEPRLTGSIPTEIKNLTNLTYLGLRNHRVSGTIPKELGDLTNLTTLDLYNNQFTGDIPKEIGNLTNLTILDLGGNFNLIGTIPKEIGNLRNLTFLSFMGNWGITGSIPVEIGNLTNLTHLDLWRNNLYGEIPIEIVTLINLQQNQLSLSNNCNLYSNDDNVKSFIDDVMGEGAYQNILDTNTHNCDMPSNTNIVPVIMYLLN